MRENRFYSTFELHKLFKKQISIQLNLFFSNETIFSEEPISLILSTFLETFGGVSVRKVGTLAQKLNDQNNLSMPSLNSSFSEESIYRGEMPARSSSLAKKIELRYDQKLIH